MTKILLVEDDYTLAMGIEYSLKMEGYEVNIGNSFSKGKELVDTIDYSLIILDVSLPDGNGFDLCRYIRQEHNTPVIFLTAQDEEVNVVMGLDMGADDYITKPFRIKELVSRIKAVIRRTETKANREYLVSGDIKINVAEYKAYKNENLIQLTPLEYRLLKAFMSNPKIVLSRSLILEKIWDIDGEFVDDNSLSVYIKRLREKIEENSSEPIYIKTLRGVGYSWDKGVRGL